MEEYFQTAKSLVREFLFFFITLILLMICNRALAGNGIDPGIDVPGYNVGGEKINISDFPVGLITDKKGSLSINDIAGRDKPDEIISSRFIVTSDSDSYWLIFNLTNNSNERVGRIIRFDEPYLETADIYYRDGDKWHREKNGLIIPIKKRKIKNRTPVFLITLGPKETKTIYLRFHSKYMLTIGLAVEDIWEYNISEHWQTLLYSIFYGAAGVIFLYNLFLFYFLRSRSYLYYVLYGSCFLVFISLYSGYIHYLFSSVGNL
jgi:hypothetical protein